jgi:hypothetical protein
MLKETDADARVTASKKTAFRAIAGTVYFIMMGEHFQKNRSVMSIFRKTESNVLFSLIGVILMQKRELLELVSAMREVSSIYQ